MDVELNKTFSLLCVNYVNFPLHWRWVAEVNRTPFTNIKLNYHALTDHYIYRTTSPRWKFGGSKIINSTIILGLGVLGQSLTEFLI